MKKIKNPWEGLEEIGYNCFGCAPHNEAGLKMEFYEDGDDIVSTWMPEPQFQGWVNTLHGGIAATLLDEIAAWVIARKVQRAAMTVNLNVRYRHPVSTLKPVEVRARIKDQRRSLVIIEEELIQDGQVCDTAEATYFCFNEEQSVNEFHFRGCELEEE